MQKKKKKRRKEKKRENGKKKKKRIEPRGGNPREFLKLLEGKHRGKSVGKEL